ncbi:MAG: Do family serine endopeptidase [Salinibacter sp.]
MSTKGKVSIAAFVGGAFLAGILFATVGANLFGFGDTVGTPGQAAKLDGSTALQQSTDASPQDLGSAFTKVAKSVNPAVVQIQARKVVEREMRNPFRGTPFEDFFGGPRGPQQEGPVRQGLGSGVVIRSDGHIVTNNHVVENAEQLSVVTLDGSEYDAKIVGTDPFSDLAVIKIDPPEDLRAISFGNSDQLSIGQWVLAFGSPLSRNLNNSVTAGIVSAIGRLRSPGQRRPTQGQNGSEISPIQNFVQTDAAINPGNSGGPLVNLNGELVGINTAIASQTGGYQGIGFAIPSNTVERVATQLIEEGDVQRARLGVRYGPASQSLIKNADLPSGAAVIGRVLEGSPAAEAGLKAGDVVTAINGEPMQNYLQIGNKIASMQPGQEVTLTIRRNGESRKITVTLGSADTGGSADDGGGDAPSQDQMMQELGLSLRNVTPEIARQLGLDSAEGVVITDVDRSKPMIRNSGLEPKQVIVEIAGQPVPDVETFQQVYGKIPAGEAFRVVVRLPQGFVDVTSLRKPSNGG